MNTKEFLATMAQDLTPTQIENCGIVEFIVSGTLGEEVRPRPLNDTLSGIIANLEKFIENTETLVISHGYGICMNYSEIFVKKTDADKSSRNYDFYSLNYFLTTAIDTGCYPIPYSNDLWQGDNLKHRIMYMQWVIRQLNILKSSYNLD